MTRLACSLFLAPLASAAFYGDPPDETHPWAIHDERRPHPPRVEPGTVSTPEQPGKPPGDAIILFDGTAASLANWSADKSPAEPTKWIVQDGALQCVPGSGYIRTVAEWGDCQLHVEWAAPSKVEGSSQGRGNSGIFPMGQVEVQVLDNYDNPTYADGWASSVYGVNPPMVHALRPPGEWQTYDIVFRRPVFKDGKEIEPGYLTVFVNGVLVQDHTPLEGGGGHRGRSKSRPFPEKGPLKLQDHGNPVRYRNIWYRPLPPRVSEGGTQGALPPERAAAIKQETAAKLREEAKGKEGKARTLLLLESLTYHAEPAALADAIAATTAFAAEVKALAPEQQDKRKGDIQQLHNALKYLAQHKLTPAFPAEADLQAIIKTREWDKKK